MSDSMYFFPFSCLCQHNGRRHYVSGVFVRPCMPESWTNIVSKISWVFVGRIWPNFHY